MKVGATHASPLRRRDSGSAGWTAVGVPVRVPPVVAAAAGGVYVSPAGNADSTTNIGSGCGFSIARFSGYSCNATVAPPNVSGFSSTVTVKVRRVAALPFTSVTRSGYVAAAAASNDSPGGNVGGGGVPPSACSAAADCPRHPRQPHVHPLPRPVRLRRHRPSVGVLSSSSFAVTVGPLVTFPYLVAESSVVPRSLPSPSPLLPSRPVASANSPH